MLVACGQGEQAFPPAPAEAEDWRSVVADWREGDPVPSVPLVDQDGRAFHLGDLAAHWVLVGFVFTHCPSPEACPLTMTKMAAVQSRWQQAVADGSTGGQSLRLLTLTLDPDRDDPATMKAYGALFGADPQLWTLATGEHDLMVKELPSLFAVLAFPDATLGIRHTVKVALLRPGLVFEAEWSNNAFEAEEVVERVRRGP